MATADIIQEGQIGRDRYQFEVFFTDDFSGLNHVTQVWGLVLTAAKQIIIVSGDNVSWGFPGGEVEPGETLLMTLNREIYEEAAAMIIPESIQPLFYQNVYKLTGTGRVYETTQVRFLAKLDHLDKFITDPDHEETKYQRLVLITELNKYIHWGKLSDLIIDRLRQ